MCYIIRMLDLNNELELTKSRRDWLTASQFDKRRRRELAGGYEKKISIDGNIIYRSPVQICAIPVFQVGEKNPLKHRYGAESGSDGE